MGTHTYDELVGICDRLERQLSRAMGVEQDLIDTRDALDRELARFRVQQALHERALTATVPGDLAELCVEALIEAFEFEFLLMYSVAGDGTLERLAQFGTEAPATLPAGAAMTLPDDNAHLLTPDHPALAGLESLNLVQSVACRVCHQGKPLLVMIGGRTAAKAAFFQPLRTEVLTPFGAMVTQVGAVWINHHLNLVVREHRYSVLFHRSNDAIFLVNPTGAIVDCNAKALELFGYNRAELTQMTVFDLGPADDVQRFKGMFARLTEDGSMRAERTCITKDGATFPGEVNASLFEIDNEVMIHSILRDLTQEKRQQRQLIESERLAALGQLIAGIAHEINTPIGVILASIGNIEQALADTLEQLPRMARELPADQAGPFFELMARARERQDSLSSREERALRRSLRKQLEQLDVPQVDALADALVDVGISENLETFAGLFKDRGQASVEAAYNLASLRRNSENIRTAVGLASKVVFALKKYVHHDHTGEMKPADLIEGLNVVLTLYSNKLKHGIELVRNFEELPMVPALIDELNQVWTNLVHNALQAMGGEGRMELIAVHDGAHVQISVVDDGPGIDAEHADRIFEPFFTTKVAGEGSGLGLDICRRIVERHNGKLWFDSVPGRTAFHVRLPVDGGVS